MGGAKKQYAKGMHTRVVASPREMHKPTTLSGYYGSPRYNANVWECPKPSTEMASSFDPGWRELDKHVYETGTEYTGQFEKVYGDDGFDGRFVAQTKKNRDIKKGRATPQRSTDDGVRTQ